MTDNGVLDELIISGPFGREGIKTDSREVGPGDMFVAIKGTVHDGHDHITEALERGAASVLCEYDPTGVSREHRERIVRVADTREALGYLSGRVFGSPSEKLDVYGVTGTNGKTTTVFLTDHVLNFLGLSAGFVSTVFIKTSGNALKRADMTTPDIMTLNRYLSEMVSDGKRSAVVEISSHALDQKRVWGIGLDSAVFTNISPEHLDYHGDMDTYLRDKAKIFSYLKPDGIAVLNADDPEVTGLREGMSGRKVLTFGMADDACVKASDVKLGDGGAEFVLSVGTGPGVSVRSALIGGHNVYNALAAVAALSQKVKDLDAVKAALETAVPVPGRMDAVDSAAPFRVLVDYAHTPNALENVLGCLRPLARGKLICVFGCGGDRDRKKRPVMGKIAADMSDRVVITSDNPRTEDPAAIIDEIEKGVSDSNNYSIITNRREAIADALKAASDGDIVVIAGKGHEDHQIIGERIIRFDDKEVAGDILKELGY